MEDREYMLMMEENRDLMQELAEVEDVKYNN